MADVYCYPASSVLKNKLNIYDKERSICDLVRLESNIPTDIVNKIKNNQEQYRRLLKYAELFQIRQKL